MSNRFLPLRAMDTLRGFVGRKQLHAMHHICRGEEKEFMFEKLREFGTRIQTMPKTYEQDGMGDNSVAYLHYFKGGMDWWITEKDMGGKQLQAYGLADLNLGNPEMGYINIEELKAHDVELDLHYIPQTIGKIKEFLRAVGRLAIAATVAVSLSACASPVWTKPNTTQGDWEQAKAECMIEAARAVPPREALVTVAGTAYSTQSCDKHRRNCTAYSSFTPPSVQQVDTNAPIREQAARACLTRKGWTENSL